LTDRVVLFVDYQNIYMSARSLFHASGVRHWNGQVDPHAVGRLLVERSPFDRVLTGVRIYRGIPDSTKNPKGYSACQKQVSKWALEPEVDVITRTLRYPRDWPAEKSEEKGIDVALAIDFALMAAKGEYDIGVLMSTDTDLRPALEAVAEGEGARAEVAAWSSPHGYSRRLSIQSRNLWCHWLDQADYQRVQDPTDYNRA
jgi:uncharacterized LabA/DUF88 family protein